jgi:hypothetical protein
MTTNANQVLLLIQNLPAEEQSNLINAMRMLEVNAQDEQYFTNVTKAMQAAGEETADITAAVKALEAKPAGLLQDLDRGLSKALSNTPHARLNATEAAEEIEAQK